MSPPPSKRLYLKNLPSHVGAQDLMKYFSSYGKIAEVKIVHDYAFVQFELQKDAEDVLEIFRRQPFLGQYIVIEFARPLRKDVLLTETRETVAESRRNAMSPPARSNFRYRHAVFVTGIPRNVCWQELKDFGRMAGGSVAFCDLDRRKRGRGFIEYFTRAEAEQAIRELDGQLLGGEPVQVMESKSEVDQFRRDGARSRSPSRGRHGGLNWPRPRSHDDSRMHLVGDAGEFQGDRDVRYGPRLGHYERRPPPVAYHLVAPDHHSHGRQPRPLHGCPPDEGRQFVNAGETHVYYAEPAGISEPRVGNEGLRYHYDSGDHPGRHWDGYGNGYRSRHERRAVRQTDGTFY